MNFRTATYTRRNVPGTAVGSAHSSAEDRPAAQSPQVTFKLNGEPALKLPEPEALTPTERRFKAEQLARRYVQVMGQNPDDPTGRVTVEKTAAFYGRNDALLERLRQIVGA